MKYNVDTIMLRCCVTVDIRVCAHSLVCWTVSLVSALYHQLWNYCQPFDTESNSSMSTPVSTALAVIGINLKLGLAY